MSSLDINCAILATQLVLHNYLSYFHVQNFNGSNNDEKNRHANHLHVHVQSPLVHACGVANNNSCKHIIRYHFISIIL